jgi:RimJ/RimL family protein N-acetyltransferase
LAVTHSDELIGVIQGSALEPSGKTIQWGFALAHPRWGVGLFYESGAAYLSYVVLQLGVERIEARTALANERAITALRRLGAQCERIIPAGLADRHTDCYLWSIRPWT